MEEQVLYKRTINKETIPSKVLNTDRPITVYLPPGYVEWSSYPVIYAHDGLEFFNYGRAATAANRLILEQGIEPFIIVGVHVDLPKRTHEYSPEGSRNDAYNAFFAEEMLPYIESRYPVRTDPGERIVAGDSLGGTAALHLALDYPSLFQNVISLSGATFGATHSRLQEETDLSKLRVYQLVGTEETDVKTEWGVIDFLKSNRITKELLEAKNARLRYKESPGRHIWGFWQQELADAMIYALG